MIIIVCSGIPYFPDSMKQLDLEEKHSVSHQSSQSIERQMETEAEWAAKVKDYFYLPKLVLKQV